MSDAFIEMSREQGEEFFAKRINAVQDALKIDFDKARDTFNDWFYNTPNSIGLTIPRDIRPDHFYALVLLMPPRKPEEAFTLDISYCPLPPEPRDNTILYRVGLDGSCELFWDIPHEGMPITDPFLQKCWDEYKSGALAKRCVRIQKDFLKMCSNSVKNKIITNFTGNILNCYAKGRLKSGV